MLKRLVKSGVVFLVVISMVILPWYAADAKEGTDYSGTVKLAQMKAKLLTASSGVTSVQYALIDDGDIVLSGQAGVSDKEDETAPTKDTMYGIGSVSKMFTTVAVMQLVDEGKVKLDTPVVKYIPDFKMADSRYKDITVRMLLNHSSGLMGSNYSNSSLLGDNDMKGYDSLLSVLATQRLKAAPGAFSVYCNDGFSLAQLLVEKVSGISFSKYIEENIAKPLNLGNTKTPLTIPSSDLLAKTYLSSSDSALPAENVSAIGAGGIYSTAEDLCEFAELFTEDTDSKVLSAASAKSMSNPEYLNGIWDAGEITTLSYGLGWDSVTTYPFTEYGIQALVKGGDTGLYHGCLIVLPDEHMAAAVLTSGGSSVYNQLLAQSILLSALTDNGTIKEIKADKTFDTPEAVSMPKEYLDYAGYYAYSGGVLIAEISKEGVLSLKTDESASALSVQKFVYTGDGKFYYMDGSIYLFFQKESNGITYLYSAGYSLIPNLGQYVSSGYLAQKIASNKISDAVKAVWEKRAEKKYFIVNEKYSSEQYVLSALITTIPMLKGIEGYAFNAAIADTDTAKMLLQIPGMYGRDLYDITFHTSNKAEYMEAGGAVYIASDAVKALSSKSSFTVKIGTDGYAQWYKVNNTLKNKKVKITVPKNAACCIYDSTGTLKYSSYLSKERTATLSAGGYIVFVGDAGANFSVKYVN